MLSIHSDSIHIIYVDYGETDTVSVSSLRILPKHLYTIPPQSIHVTLAGIIGHEKSIPFFKRYESKNCRCKILDSYGSSLICDEAGALINENMIKQGWGGYKIKIKLGLMRMFICCTLMKKRFG